MRGQKKGFRHSEETKNRIALKAKQRLSQKSIEERQSLMAEARKKLKNICLSYGVENISQIKEINTNKVTHGQQTCLERYGVENPFQLSYVQERAKHKKAEFWNDPNSTFSKKWSETSSKVTKALWQDDSYVRKVKKGWALKPNFFELRFWQLFPTLRYTGDFAFRIVTKKGSRFPDFTVVPEESKKIIETNGIYWHSILLNETKEQHEQDTVSEYAEVGYKCLVIWEDDFKDKLEEVKEKVRIFISNGSSTTLRQTTKVEDKV